MENRRRYDQEILDEIREVKGMVHDIQVDRAVMKDNIVRLEAVDGGTRLTKIETTQKNYRYILGLAMALPAMAFSALRYFKM